MENPVFKSYLEFEKAAKLTRPILSEDDYRRCIAFAAYDHDLTYEEARQIVSDNISTLGAG